LPQSASENGKFSHEKSCFCRHVRFVARLPRSGTRRAFPPVFKTETIDAERLVKGRERIDLDRFWNEFSADPKNFDEASRKHYAALYARPGAMHAGFEQFKAFDQDAITTKPSSPKAC
jgi:hypothetical protein